MSCQFQFISHTGADSTERERELRNSDIKKHAATVAHKRRVISAAGSGFSVPVPQGQQGPLHKNLTWLLVTPKGQSLVSGQHGGTRKATKAAIESPRKEDDEYFYGTIAPMHQPLFMNLELLPALDDSMNRYHGYMNAMPLRVNPSSTPNLILSMRRAHSAGAYRALEYFMQVLIPNNAPVYRIFQVSNVNCFTFLEIAEKSQRPYVAHSALALLHLVLGNIAPETSSGRNALQHVVAALAMIRSTLTANDFFNDDAAFVSVVCLAAFARALNDQAAYRVHRDRLAHMIEERGGLASTGFEGFVRALTLQFAPPDCIPLSLCFERPLKKLPETMNPNDPFFFDTREVLTGIPMPVHSYVDKELASSVKWLPHGFRCLRHEGALSVKTIQLLCRINEARKMYKPGQEWNLAGVSSVGGWQPAQYSDFWECCPSISRSGPDLEKYLCLALLLYTANEFAPQRVFHKGLALYSGPRAVLASEIGSLNRLELSQTERECWMWIWWVLIDSWTDDGWLAGSAGLLISQFWATFPEVADATALHLVLERFFWGGKFEGLVSQIIGDENIDEAGTPHIVKEGRI